MRCQANLGAYLGVLWVLAALAGCRETPVEKVPGSAGSETHWLGSCYGGQVCPADTVCLCGVCTAPCEADDVCGRDERAATCAGPAVAGCVTPAPVAGVCAADCGADADCADGQRCAGGACVADVEPATGDEGAPPATGVALRQVRHVVPGRPRVDFLFVVDDSGSMCEEQASLARNFAAFAPTLAELDYRVAVVSTDLFPGGPRGAFGVRPAEPVPALNCVDPDSGDPLVPDTADCAGLLEAGALPAVLTRGDGDFDAGYAATWFRCAATLGTQGDGFEKGLEAMRLALACDGPNAARFDACCADGRYDPTCEAAVEFLRPDAALVVVFVTDEDDCSQPVDNRPRSTRAICRYGPIDGDGDGVPDGFSDPALCPDDPAACYARECGAMPAEACASTCVVSRADNSNCVWDRDRLTPVDDYAAFLAGLKAGPSVSVWSFVGPPRRSSTGEAVHYVRGEPAAPSCAEVDADAALCCPDGVCPGPAQPTCESDNGIAYGGDRYVELASRFAGGCVPGGPVPCDICAGELDLQSAYDVAPIQAAFCLPTPPACLVAADGTLRSCAGDERADPRNLALQVTVACERTRAEGGDCDVRLAPTTLGPDQLVVRLDAPECPGEVAVKPVEAPPRGATVTLTYLEGSL